MCIRDRANQFTDRLNSITRQASALLLDDDLIHISHQTESELDLLDLVTFQRKATLYRATNFVDNDLTIFFPRQNWMISTQHGAEHLSSSLQPAVNAGQWSIRPTLRNGNELCLASYLSLIHISYRRWESELCPPTVGLQFGSGHGLPCTWRRCASRLQPLLDQQANVSGSPGLSHSRTAH